MKSEYENLLAAAEAALKTSRDWFFPDDFKHATDDRATLEYIAMTRPLVIKQLIKDLHGLLEQREESNAHVQSLTETGFRLTDERDRANARAEACKALLLDYRRSHSRCTDDWTASDHFDNRCAFCRTIDQTISEQEAKAKEREG